ncbi:hypothetical protein PG996_000238 [Apiospora saccharicola]|uniref:Uncharacterized protein n=1 Tax=Apiospora saccharicola TaxID=335842 RepID=A0ABR1WEK5_9PEZI
MFGQKPYGQVDFVIPAKPGPAGATFECSNEGTSSYMVSLKQHGIKMNNDAPNTVQLGQMGVDTVEAV